MHNHEIDIAIVGAGISGLACADMLRQAGRAIVLLEASDRVGGRIRTDMVEGYRLDHGFQVLIDSYPVTRSVLDFDALRLHRFKSGALIRFDDRLHRFLDVWREPLGVFSAATSPVGTLQDKLLIAKLRLALQGKSDGALFSRDNLTTEAYLRDYGFSTRMIDRFFRPFFGGIFLERDLESSRRMFEYIFSLFAEGNACLPEEGMAAIPAQLADKLEPDALRLNCPVESIEGQTLQLADGGTFKAKHVVVATDGPAASRLLPQLPSGEGRAVTCLYFKTESSPLKENILALDGSGEGIINNFCVPTDVTPSYGPEGKSLVSVTILGAHDPDSLCEEVLEEAREWFGDEVMGWEYLRGYRVPYALPDQAPPNLDPVVKAVQLKDGLYVCGDHRHTASIEGAVRSGLAVASAILE